MGDFGAQETDPKSVRDSGTYQLGDVTEEQGKGLDELFGRPASARYVYMNAEASAHFLDWMHRCGFEPEDMVEFIGQAMEEAAIPEMCMTERGPIPSLVNRGVRDLATGLPYDVRLLFYQVDGGYLPLTLILEGLSRRTGN